jgi:hypothetical protein
MVRDGREALKTFEPGYESVDWDAFWSLCAFKGTPRLPKDASSAFAQLFSPQMTPLSYARDWHSNGRDIVAKRRWKGDTLVVYAYHETPDAKENMAYFLRHGLRNLMAHVAVRVAIKCRAPHAIDATLCP